MFNTSQTIKIVCSWVSIVWVICFAGVALIPGVREWFMEYALHVRISLGENVMTPTTFISGLIIWNVFAAVGVWLYGVLANYFRS